MRFVPTTLPGVLVIEQDRREDERGFFARTWCAREFEGHGLETSLAQCSVSFNSRRGTLRGLHYQARPHEEAKLVRCTRGAMWDVAVDLREGSPTRHRWHAVELTADNYKALYIAEGLAHGFQTLADDTEVLYIMSTPYHPASSRGLRWNDARLAIAWPLPDPIVSERDRAFPVLA